MKLAFRALYALIAVPLAASAPAAARADAVTLRKDWAFARCLARTASGQPAGEDAAKSAAALLERASGGMEVYERLESLAARFAGESYAGSTGARYGVLKCLDLYHSRALDQVARGRRLGR